MKKISINFIGVLFGIAAFFFLSNVALAAQQYTFGLEAYNITSSCSLDTKDDALDCWDKLVAGELEDYKITDGRIEAGEKLMVLMSENVVDSELASVVLSIFPDLTKLNVYDYKVYNESTPDDLLSDGGIYTSTGCRKGVCSHNWTVAMSYVDNGFTFLSYDTQSTIDPTPLVNDGYLAAMFYEVKDDIQPGDSVTFRYPVENKQLVSIVDKWGEELMEYASFNSLTLSVVSEISGDGTLKELTAKGNNDESYPFDFVPSSKDDLNYSFVVPNVVDEVGFYGTPTSSAIKGGTGFENIPAPEISAMSIAFINGHSLDVGHNSLTLTVTAESGDVTIYSVDVLRLSNDSSLQSVSATNGITFPTPLSVTDINTVTVPYKTSSTNIIATPNHEEARVDAGDGLWDIKTDNETDTSNSYSIVVNAEDCKEEYKDVPGNTCSSSTYEFEIVRTAPSKNVNLSSLMVDGELVFGFDPETMEYTLADVAANKTSVDVSATLADSLNKIFINEIETQSLDVELEVGDNTIVVKTLSEDGVTDKEYKIHIHRLSDDKDLSDLRVSSTPQANLFPSFNSNTPEYMYSYDASVSSVSITATAHDTDKAYISIIDMSSSDTIDNSVKMLNTATATFDETVTKVGVIVTAEDGSTKVYTVSLSRALSSNSELSGLSITPGSLNETFVSTKRDYTAEVDPDVSSVKVNYTLKDSHSTIQSITGADNLNFGTNRITVVVEAEDKSVTNYIIDVIRKEYDIATLSHIKVGYDGSTPSDISGFTENILSYTLSTKLNPIAYATKTIQIDYEKSNEYAVVSGDIGTIDLDSYANKTLVSDGAIKNVYEYTFTIHVTSQDGSSTKDYVLTMYQEANNDKSVSSVKVHGEDAAVDANDTHIYRITLGNEKTTVTQSDVDIVAGGTVNMKTTSLTLSTENDNIFEYEVVAENGEKETYQIYITREKSSNAEMTRVNLTIDGETSATRYCLFENGSTTCKIEVPTETEGYTLNTILAHEKATVVPLDGTHFDMTDPLMHHKFIVTAEDGTTEKEFIVEVERGLSSNNYFAVLQSNANSDTLVDVPGFDAMNPVTPDYYLTVPYSQKSITIHAEADVNAKLTSEDYSGVVGSTIDITKDLDCGSDNKVVITVQAENKTEKIYTIHITRSENTEARLSMIYIDGNPINDYLTGTSFDADASKDPENTNYDYQLDMFDYSKTEIAVTADPMDLENGSVDGEETYQIETVYANDGKGNYLNKIEIIGIAHDQSTRKYTIYVPRKGNDSTVVDDIKMSYDNHEYSATKIDADHYEITVPNHVTFANSSNVLVSIPEGALSTDAKATVSMSETTLKTDDLTNNNRNTHVIRITAEDGTTRDITLTITRELSSNAELNTLMVQDTTGANIGAFTPAFDKVTGEYTVNVPESTEDFVIAFTKGEDHQTVVGDGRHTLSSSNEDFEVEVTAEDGTLKKYMLHIVRAASTNNNLDTIEVEDLFGNQYSVQVSDGKYIVNVPNNVDKVNVIATPEISTSNVDYIGKDVGTDHTYTLVVGINSIEVQIISESQDRKSYTLEITREGKSDNTLASLKYKLSVDGEEVEIDLDTLPYVIPTVANSVDKIWFVVETSDENATVTGDGERALVVGSNTLDIVVKAENGEEKVYQVSVEREDESNDNELTSLKYKLSVDGEEVEIDLDTLPYVIPTVANSVDKIWFIVETSDENATVTGDGERALVVGSNTFDIVVKAENGEEKIYQVSVNRASEEEGDEEALASLEVVDAMDESVRYPLTPEFRSEVTRYDIGKLPYALTHLKINAVASEADAKITYFVNGMEQASEVVTIPLESGVITVKVGDNEYEITYEREESSTVTLTDITVKNHELDPEFKSDTYEYALTLPSDEDSLDIAATVSDGGTIKINGEDYVSGSDKTIDNIPYGDSTITIETYDNGVFVGSYKIVITRESETEMITSYEYGHTIEDGYIMTVSDNTAVLDMKDQLDNDNSKLKIYESDGVTELSDTDLVGTGKVVKLFVDEVEVDSKVIIVLGDTTGDGIIDIFDSSAILNHFMERQSLEGAYLVAGDLTKDGIIDIFDSSAVLNHFMERKAIEFMPSKETNEE